MEPTTARSITINNQLPDDVLADVLSRLPPRCLAAARCVCAAWRATIDDRRLLRTDLLPLSLAGIFIHFDDLRFPEFFSRPSTPTTPAISGKLDYMPNKYALYAVNDHCNGLLLLYTHVVNPATRRCVTLPLLPPSRGTFSDNYIVFDPTVSPHYEVIKIPYLMCNMRLDPIIRESEWPPSPFLLNVFSSATKQWEDRLFVREGEAAGTIGDLVKLYSRQHYAAYWHGALYVHRCNYVTRLLLTDGKYKVIKNPQDIDMSKCLKFYLGKSEKGVYLASLEQELDLQLSVWILNESCAKAKWVLKHRKNLKPLLLRWGYHQVNGPWILQDVNYDLYRKNFGGPWFYNVTYDDLLLEGNNEVPVEDKYEWYSDNDDVDHDTQDGVEEQSHVSISLLGFHPYREIVFLSLSCERGVAYHLNSSKMQDLGSIFPQNFNQVSEVGGGIEASFPYTPCWIGEFPEISSEDHLYRN
uniref:F-box domain-containing protein n=1 Tax=Oryza meridionalis TaxID=40149 RepID=A0A0E0D4C1_9ORYZ